MKTVKRLIVNNTGPHGQLNTDLFQRAMLAYRNTPSRGTTLSPAVCVFGRPIKDFIPILPGKYRPHETWQSTFYHREEVLRNYHMKTVERLSEHTRRLVPLKVGDRVRIQNQVGSNPRNWDKTGMVIEVRQFDQYVARVDGSGRVTLRNRKYLRKYAPFIQHAPPACIRSNQSPEDVIRHITQPIQSRCVTPAVHNPPSQAPESTIHVPPVPLLETDTSQSVPCDDVSPPTSGIARVPSSPVKGPLHGRSLENVHSSPTTTSPSFTPRRSTRNRQQPTRLQDYVI